MSAAGRTVHSDFIAGEIEKEIISRRLRGGVKLDEAALARRFGVSRTPVREALQIVVSRSLAERVPYKGVVVLDIDEERIGQMFEAMGELEAACARLCAERMTMGERAQLEHLHARMGEMAAAGDHVSYEQTNTAFHALIYTGARNEDLEHLANAMRLKLAPFRSSQLQTAARIARSNEEHQIIVSAIIDRKGREAERALRRHLLSAAQAVLSTRG